MLENVINSCQEHSHKLMSILLLNSPNDSLLLFNPCSIPRQHQVLVPEEDEQGTATSLILNPFSFQDAPHTVNNNHSSCSTLLLSSLAEVYLLASPSSSQFTIGNQFIEVIVSPGGSLLSFVDKRMNPPRQILQTTDKENLLVGNNLVLYDDVPLFWDAWDVMPYHLMTGRSLNGAAKTSPSGEGQQSQYFRVKTLTAVEVILEVVLTGWSEKGSEIKMEIQLTKFSPLLSFKLEVDWHEAHKLLKVEFPLSIQSPVARYETQFGYTERPTHTNHSTDASMFEVCGHRYGSLSEPGYGVALLNDCKYGYSCRESVLCLSLLRAPKSPDPECDMGQHVMKYALYPHQGSLLDLQSGCQVVSEAILFNTPLVMTSPSPSALSPKAGSLFATHLSPSFDSFLRQGIFDLQRGSSLVLDTIKVTEDCEESSKSGEGGVILRFYESLGARGSAVLISRVSPSSASLVDLSETILAPLEGQLLDDGAATRYSLPYKPFQILSVKLVFE
jgi:alpha-mannosidase